MSRSKRRERVDALTSELGLGRSEGSRVAWAVPVTQRPPLLFAQRRRHIVVRAADDLLLVRPRWRKALEPRDVVARIPYERATVERHQRGPLRQLLVAADPDGPDDDRSAYALEFRFRDRHFVNGLERALKA